MSHKKKLSKYFLATLFLVQLEPGVAASDESSDKIRPGFSEGGYLMAEKTSGNITKKIRKKKKKEAPPPEDSPESTQKEPSESPTGLASQRTVRGLLGFYMGKNSAIIFGAGATLPHSKTIALDGGFDYVKFGNEVASVSLMRFAGGAAYILPTGPESTLRLGGRVGIARVSFSYSIPPLFEGDSATSGSESSSSLYGEGRAAYEMKMGGLILGGEVQLPLFMGDKSISGTDSIAIYGSLGMAF